MHIPSISTLCTIILWWNGSAIVSCISILTHFWYFSGGQGVSHKVIQITQECGCDRRQTGTQTGSRVDLTPSLHLAGIAYIVN